MRYRVAVALGIALFITASASQGANRERQSEPARGTSADVRELTRLENDWAAGLVRRDGALFRRLLAKGFIYTENDLMMGRDQLLRELLNGSDRVTAAHNERMRVHSFGPAAVVTGWLVVRGHGKTGPFDRRYRFTDTWVRDGDWQIVAAHDYLAPAGSR
jgi:hypothetical protein